MRSDYKWIKLLKVGDEVAIDNSSTWRRNDYSIAKVVKITPSGRIELSNGSKYMPDGKRIGSNYDYPLREITTEIMNIIERRNLLNKLDINSFIGKLDAERLKILLQWQEELKDKK